VKHALLASTIAAFLLGVSASASAGVIATESFESPALSVGAIQYGPAYDLTNDINSTGPASAPNFTFNGYSGIASNGNAYLPPTPFGLQTAFIQAYPAAGSNITWNVAGFTPGKTYTLYFYDAGYGGGADTLDVSAFASSADYTPSSDSIYGLNSLTFTATSTSGTIEFLGTSSGGDYVTEIDDLSIVSSVPEPSTWAMMMVGLGGLGVGLRVRRRIQALAAT
jgi:hypothetical protein